MENYIKIKSSDGENVVVFSSQIVSITNQGPNSSKIELSSGRVINTDNNDGAILQKMGIDPLED